MSLDLQLPGSDPFSATDPSTTESPAAICSIDPGPDGNGLVLRGELDLSNADVVAAALAEASRDGIATVLDMSGVSFLDSSGLRTLVQHSTRGKELTILDPSPQVARLLELTAMAEVFTIVHTVDHA